MKGKIPTEKEISKWLNEGKVVVIGEEKGIINIKTQKRIV